MASPATARCATASAFSSFSHGRLLSLSPCLPCLLCIAPPPVPFNLCAGLVRHAGAAAGAAIARLPWFCCLLACPDGPVFAFRRGRTPPLQLMALSARSRCAQQLVALRFGARATVKCSAHCAQRVRCSLCATSHAHAHALNPCAPLTPLRWRPTWRPYAGQHTLQPCCHWRHRRLPLRKDGARADAAAAERLAGVQPGRHRGR